MKKTINYLLMLFLAIILGILIPINGFTDQKSKAVDNTFDQSATVSDTVCFGRYEQDNVADNGHECIEWIVLERQGSNAFLTSKYVLDCRQYHFDIHYSSEWENCELRDWLNNSFLNTAFTKEEQKMIQTTNVLTELNPCPPKNTTDKIFLLSHSEYEKYFPDNTGACMSTEFANRHENCVDRDSETGNAFWWLRTDGANESVAISVTGTGVAGTGGRLKNVYGGVRPAMWVDLDALEDSLEESKGTINSWNDSEQSLYDVRVDNLRILSGEKDLTPEHAWPTLHYGESITLRAEIYSNTASKLDTDWEISDLNGKSVQYFINEDDSITLSCIGLELKNIQVTASCCGTRESIVIYIRP